MNHLLIGHADKTEQLLQIPHDGFLLIDDGPIADRFADAFPGANIFNPRRHSFNPLPMSYRDARDFAAMLYAASPEGETTLTVRNGRRILTKLFCSGAMRLSDFPSAQETTDPFEKEALAMISDLLLSPVLKRVLCRKPNFDFAGSIIAKINRADLGDYDAFLLACMLVGQFRGQVIVPDFGFYGREFYTSLLRQNRLIAGLNSFSEVSPPLQQALLGAKDKTVYRTTREDAERLMFYIDPAGNPSRLVEQEGSNYLSTA